MDHATKIAVIALIFSTLAHVQLLPLSRAVVVFDERGVKVTQGFNEKGEFGDEIELTLKNFGRATARNIEFKSYGIFEETAIFESTGTRLIKFFDEKIINELSPGGEVAPGAFIFVKYDENLQEPYIKNLRGKKLIILFSLKYRDSIYFIPRSQEKTFFFKYYVGDPKVYSLAWSDYQNIYSTLVEELKSGGNKDDVILDFLESNNPGVLSENLVPAGDYEIFKTPEYNYSSIGV